SGRRDRSGRHRADGDPGAGLNRVIMTLDCSRSRVANTVLASNQIEMMLISTFLQRRRLVWNRRSVTLGFPSLAV
ncbi:MAG TPA: hypothetical protein VL574_04410, partial [Stellaceae bacterium]|nr:hypothetical protein [Stellaceae bacterium]